MKLIGRKVYHSATSRHTAHPKNFSTNTFMPMQLPQLEFGIRPDGAILFHGNYARCEGPDLWVISTQDGTMTQFAGSVQEACDILIKLRLREIDAQRRELETQLGALDHDATRIRRYLQCQSNHS